MLSPTNTRFYVLLLFPSSLTFLLTSSHLNHSLAVRTQDHLGLDFPNLPYLIDGDLKITQRYMRDVCVA